VSGGLARLSVSPSDSCKMNSPDNSPFSIGGANMSPEYQGKNWKVPDSFKVTKLRVTSREELMIQKAKEEQRKKDVSKTSDAKSYLKSRRSKARNERRSEILSVLDHNLEKIASTSQDEQKEFRPSSPARSPTHDSRAKLQYRVAVTSEHKGSSSGFRNRNGNTEERHGSPTSSSPKQQNRLRVLNPFRNRSKDAEVEQDKQKRNEICETAKPDPLKRTKSDRRTTRRRKEQKEAIQSVKHGNRDREAEMQEILEDVLRKYPKEKCRTYADHKEFAFAELSTQSNHRKDLQITTEKFIDLKSKLQSRLASTLGEGRSDLEVQEHSTGQHTHRQEQPLHRNQSHVPFGQPRNQCQQNQGRDLQPSLSTSPRRHSQRRLVQATSDMPSPRRTSHPYHHRSTGPSSPRSPSTSSPPSNPACPRNRMTSPTKQVSPRHMRSVVHPPDFAVSSQPKSPTFPGSEERDATKSPQGGRTSTVSISSKSLTLPKPRSTSLDDHLPPKGTPFDKEDSTSMTELDDESTLVPVVKLLIVDPSGNIGKYTGTICVNTGKPHGSGKLEYEGSGSYHGDWNQGSWSGYGRHAKPNGDIYEGNFFDNNKHGMGTYRYRDGKRVFEGRYVMGQRVDGQMTYGDGSVYRGQWYDGKRHGRGIYRFKDSSIYKGEFLQDVIHGVGQLVWPDGAKYVGEWNQGHRHGMGKEFASDGRLRYEGKWKQSVPAS
jgi:hypothetical protein